jgi:DNA-binding response OmpR family regulator
VDKIKAMAKVLIVEDDEVIAKGMASHLVAAGFDPLWVSNGQAGLARLRYEQLDVCIVDLMLPMLDGWTLIENARSEGIGTPVVVVSARGSEEDRVRTLELGADDYMVKPFEPREVVARVNTILRRLERSGGPRQGTGQTARFSGWTFEESRNRLTAPEGREVELSAAEARLLGTLLRQPNRILNRAALLGDADREPLDRSIDARISRLRRKLQVPDDGPELIKTVYGAGYMLVAKVEWD